MPDPAIVGVRVGPSGPVHFYATEDPGLDVGDLVSVPAASGPADARVVIAPHQVLNADLEGVLDSVLGRVAPGKANGTGRP